MDNPFANQTIYVSGHGGMVGSCIVRALRAQGVSDIITRTRSELDLCDQRAVNQFFSIQRPDIVIYAAARVGGIHANNAYPAEFIYENLAMAVNAIHAAWQYSATRFLFLGSTCIYPRMAPQPMSEDSLLTGPLEKTNEAYAMAKIAGVKMCEYYRTQYGVLFHSAMPTNLYGPGDNYHPDNSHVLPAMIRRFHNAKQQQLSEVEIWGTGKPRREFLHVDDLTSAVIHLVALDNPPNLINVGTGTDITIHELAEMVSDTVGYKGKIAYDTSKPDGTPVKRTDIRLIESTGWKPKIELADGIRMTYNDFLKEAQTNELREV